ncbi:hypothetical protein [[Scytonema hofmanni] UTEX B 1581]|uniref:hypothetical protein n=1 Tax=[Scytonema hofmanni] UTEX B 1581 TaxID=379535 RepID=UPI001183E2C8|nr:hypothetical protein [[Scytonema hofmanni] UTEX B 1581]
MIYCRAIALLPILKRPKIGFSPSSFLSAASSSAEGNSYVRKISIAETLFNRVFQPSAVGKIIQLWHGDT